MTARLELRAQLRVVVDLAVVGDPYGAVLVGHRLMASGGEVDDRQAPMAQRHPLVRAHARAAVVGAAMTQHVGHARHGRFVDPEPIIKREDAGDAAHACYST